MWSRTSNMLIPHELSQGSADTLCCISMREYRRCGSSTTFAFCGRDPTCRIGLSDHGMNQKGYDSLRLPSIDLTMHDLQFSMNQSAKNSLSSLLTESVRQVMRDDMPRKIS
jgi:hypothetical protein